MLKLGRYAYLSKPIFSKWPMHDVTKPCIHERSFKVQDRPMDFEVIE